MHNRYFNSKVVLLFGLLVVCSTVCLAQLEAKDFIQYSVKDGLSDNYVTSFQQDEKGFMWIGTDMGLNQFDGHSFKTYFQESKNISLASSKILQLKNFGKHRMGIISFGGFQMLNTASLGLQDYFLPDTTAFRRYLNGVQDAALLQGNRMMLSTAAGIYVLDNNSRILYRHDYHRAQDQNRSRKIYGKSILPISAADYLVFVHERSLVYFNADSLQVQMTNRDDANWQYFQHPKPPAGDGWLTTMKVSAQEYLFMHWQKDSIVYYNRLTNKAVVSALPVHVSTVFNWDSKMVKLDSNYFAINDAQTGFYIFNLDAATGKVTFSSQKILEQFKINTLLLDKDKRLWIGTSKGVLQQKLQKSTLQSFSFSPMSKDTITGGIACMYRYKNIMYLGRYSRRYGLLIANATTMQPLRQITLFGQDNMWNEIRSIQMYHPDTLWLGTNGGIVWFDTKSERYGKVTDAKNPAMLLNFSAFLAPVNADGYAWMCSVLDGVVARYHVALRSFEYFTSQTSPALPFGGVKSIVYDSYGDVWISGHGLTRWNSRISNFDTLITVYAGVNKFSDDILTITADDYGSLWMHNAYNGLLQYRIKEKQFKSYTEKDGLPNDEIRCLSTVKNNMLFIGSHNSLMMMDIEAKKFKVYDYNDGLPGERPSARKIYLDEDADMMYMPMNNHVVGFSPKKMDKPANGSNLIIQEVKVNNDKSFFYPPDQLHLQSDENSLTVNFTVIDFEDRHNFRFAYMINEADSWTTLDEQRSINFTGLSAGNYSIKIKAIGKAGNSQSRTIQFIIHPPFWKETKFILFVFMVLAILGYFLYKYRIGRIEQKANLDKLLAQTEIKALHAQMNPHFIFNSLNSIREMILDNQNKDASHFLGKFAQLIRLTLDQSGKSFISLKDTLGYLNRYIEMEQIRNELFTSSIVTDDGLDLDETFLPPMLIQPFIENALWHGIKADDRKININIAFKKSGDDVVCLIEDDGIGIEASLMQKKISGAQYHSVGISNIKNRIQLLNEKYHLQFLLFIEDKKHLYGYNTSGTLVTLKLPIKSGNDE